MAKVEAVLLFAKQTEGAYMWKEAGNRPPTVNTLYLKKYAVGTNPPASIKVTVEWD